MELNVDLRALTSVTDVSDHNSLVAVWAPYVKVMLSALAKMPQLAPGIYYRGRTDTFTSQRKIYTAGREVVWAGFTSVSVSIDQAGYLAGWENGTVYELSLIDVRDISSVSFYPQEREGILVTNTRLAAGTEVKFAERVDGLGQTHLLKLIPFLQMGSSHTRIVS